MRRSIALALALVGLPAFALAKAPAAPPTLIDLGKPRSCISTPQVRSIEPLGPRALWFRMEGKPDYRSDLASDCRFDPDFDTLVHVSPDTNYCEGEILRVRDRTSPIERGSCIVGPFTPVRKLSRAQ